MKKREIDHIAENIKDFIDSRGYLRKFVAHSINESPSVLSHLLNRNKDIPISVIVKLADFFQVSIDELIGRHEFSKPKELTEKQKRLLEAYDKLSDESKQLLEQIIKRFD